MIDPVRLSHRMVETNGINMHVAEAAGVGPTVVLCHGFPEGWYSWRRQITELAAAGYHVLAPDLRGYGRTDHPASAESYTQLHTVGDVVGLLDAVGVVDAIVVGHDFGALVAWNAALMRPDRVSAVVGMSLPYRPRGPMSIMEALSRAGASDNYMVYFQTPGLAEAEFERDVRGSITRFLFSASGDAPADLLFPGQTGPSGKLLERGIDAPADLEWLTDNDIELYLQDFARNGFTGGLNWYRNLHRNWELLAPYAGAQIHQPSMFIVGERDATLRFPGMSAAVDGLASALPGLRSTHIVAGAGHWVHAEKADVVNLALLNFLSGL